MQAPPQCNTDMFYKFQVETLQLRDNSPYHMIAKCAANAESAMAMIANEAEKFGLSINNIEFYGQFNEMPDHCTTTFRGEKMPEMINLRVLQQDTEDQIRIGAGFPAHTKMLDKVVENTIKQYGKELEWCGGFQEGCKRYYKRIALVNADTLQSVREIYPGKEA